MEDKGWLGSELMFDIDSDHIKDCEKIEIQAKSGRVSIINRRCIELAKEHELKLIDILKNDFGFSEKEILVYFSGNRGFHTVVRPSDDDWLKLNSYLRRELVDYIKGIGLDLSIILPKERKGIRLIQPMAKYGGWRGRISSIVLSYEEAVDKQDTLIKELAVEIDEQVTQDISRLVRIPGTINGKSGMPAIYLPKESDVIGFEYGAHLSPFQGYAVVELIEKLPKNIKVLEFEVNTDKKTQKIPLPIALYLTLNDLAIIKSIL